MHYIICSSARSGSTLLAEALREMGAGKPEEYLSSRIHNGQISTLCNRENFMLPTPEVYLERIKQENAVNGIFGLKTHYSQLASFPAILENITHLLPDAKYIAITRRNNLRQAISATRAIQTQAWTAQLAEQKKPKFSYVRIIRQLIILAREAEMWERFYAKNKIRPLRVLYEELDEDYEFTMRRVMTFLGITGNIPPPPLKKQADAITEEWAERFSCAFRNRKIVSGIFHKIDERL